jgi:hypothetical protein
MNTPSLKTTSIIADCTPPKSHAQCSMYGMRSETWMARTGIKTQKSTLCVLERHKLTAIRLALKEQDGKVLKFIPQPSSPRLLSLSKHSLNIPTPGTLILELKQ